MCSRSTETFYIVKQKKQTSGREKKQKGMEEAMETTYRNSEALQSPLGFTSA